MQDDLKLTKLERIFLVNQLRILEALYPLEAEKLSIQREAFECGYELLYDLESQYISDGDNIMSASNCQEVFDTMDMFVAIKRSLEQDIDFTTVSQMKFSGYDGNNETNFMSFARFVFERWGRFQDLPMEKPGVWNSHYQARPRYQRMLTAWKEVPAENRFAMSSEQLTRIHSAATNPDNR